MKSILIIYVTFIVTTIREVSSATWYDCTCVPYDQCNVDYIIKSDATDIHETLQYSDEKPRPVCNAAIDVCCDFQDQTSNNDEKKHNWSCGARGKCSDIDIGQVANAEVGEFPWVVAIFRNDYGYYAGGSLINEKAILTAAHKVYKLKSSELIVHAGSCHLRSDREIYYEGTVSSIHIHPNFEEKSHINDYAILILSESAKPTANVNSICLAESNSTYDISKCIATGWSQNRYVVNSNGDNLMKSHVNVIDRKKCEDNYQKVYDNYNFKIHNSIVCAGDNEYRDPCVSDAGSPIICPLKLDSKHYVQVGISSIAVCNEKYKPGLYADIANGYKWIFQVVESHGLRTKSFTT